MDLRVCPWWLSFIVGNSLRRLIHDGDAILRQLIQEGQKAIDIGCGPGFFTIPMARLVGKTGRVIAVDVQAKMLDFVRRRAKKEGLQSRIHIHQCTADAIGIQERVGFALAFYMVHEVPDVEAFFKEIVGILEPDGIFLLTEPVVHVTASHFKEIVRVASEAGLKPDREVPINFSRTRLFSLK